MHDAVAVRVVQRRGDSAGDTQCFVDRKLSLTIEFRAQRFTVNEGHHVEQQPVGLTRVEEGEHVWVLQMRRDTDLGEEALGTE